MAKTAGGVRGAKAKRMPLDVQSVKSGLVRYAMADKRNRNSEYRLGFNDDAQSVVDNVAKGNYGFASQVAQTVQRYNYRISEKQAYVIARAAVENEVTGLRDIKTGNAKEIFSGYGGARGGRR